MHKLQWKVIKFLSLILSMINSISNVVNILSSWQLDASNNIQISTYSYYMKHLKFILIVNS